MQQRLALCPQVIPILLGRDNTESERCERDEIRLRRSLSETVRNG